MRLLAVGHMRVVLCEFRMQKGSSAVLGMHSAAGRCSVLAGTFGSYNARGGNVFLNLLLMGFFQQRFETVFAEARFAVRGIVGCEVVVVVGGNVASEGGGKAEMRR